MDIQDMGCHPSLSSQEGNWLEMKYNLDGSVNHYKARLIAKGYMQKHTVLTMKRHLPQWQRWRLFEPWLHLQWQKGGTSIRWTTQLRIQHPSESSPPIKEAPRAWHSKITQYLHRIGFRLSKSDNSLYVRSDFERSIVIILYVDDLVIGGEHLVDINKVKSLLSRKFKLMSMKELHYFLCIEVIQTPAGIMISQWHYILNLFYKFGMIECKYVATPLESNSMPTLAPKSVR